MSGDVGAEVAAVLGAERCKDIHSTRWDFKYGVGICLACESWGQHAADDLEPLIAERVEAAKAEALAPIEAHRAWLENERDSIRAAYIGHNAGRAEGRPVKRPDLDTWANAYEVAERHLRAALDPEATP